MGNDRAYSVLTLKAFDEGSGARRFSGLASTPSTDRMDDIVEPLGMKASLPTPLLWQHDKHQPIGWVRLANANANGIEVECELAELKEPGRLKDRLDEAWQSIKAGLVRGLSIGFKPIAAEQIKGSFGMRFKAWELLELSAVTIPANAEASILAIKAADSIFIPRAASGVIQLVPGVTGHPKGFTVNIQDQIKSFEASRQAKEANRFAIQQKALEDGGRTKDAQEKQEFDDLSSEIESIDIELKDLRKLEASNMSTAKPVVQKAQEEVQRGSTIEVGNMNRPVIKAPYLKGGLAMAQVVKLIGMARGNLSGAFEMAKGQNQGLDPRVVNVLKAAVAAGTTAHTTWASPLVGDESSVFADFVEFLRPQTILGKMENLMRRVPFRTRLIEQTSGGEGYWVGEGQAKPLTKYDLAGTTMTPLKVANIAVVTKELLRDSSPAADVWLRDELVKSLRARLDIDFIDPDKALVANISPASITNGITPIPSSGNDTAAVKTDIAALFDQFIDANNDPSTGVWIMSAKTAHRLGMMQNPLGQNEFPGIGMSGGTFQGMPVIVSQYVPADSTGGLVVLVNATDIWFGDEGGFEVSMSDQASLQMDNAPTHNSTTPTPAQMVSMWQTNCVAFLAERAINWARRRDESVAVLSEVQWGTA